MAELKTDIEKTIQTNKDALVTRAKNSDNLTYILDRMGGAKSPVKRQSAPEKIQDSVTSGEDEPAPKKGRRKTVAPAQE
jgi:hypothetical protein